MYFLICGIKQTRDKLNTPPFTFCLQEIYISMTHSSVRIVFMFFCKLAIKSTLKINLLQWSECEKVQGNVIILCAELHSSCGCYMIDRRHTQLWHRTMTTAETVTVKFWVYIRCEGTANGFFYEDGKIYIFQATTTVHRYDQ